MAAVHQASVHDEDSEHNNDEDSDDDDDDSDLDDGNGGGNGVGSEAFEIFSCFADTNPSPAEFANIDWRNVNDDSTTEQT